MSISSKRIQCPGCLQFDCYVVDGHRSVCRLCSKSLRQIYNFCWACRREWPRVGSECRGSVCALPECAKRASLLSGQIISDPSSAACLCPFFRACPSCKALLTHDGVGCRYITCPDCRTNFCFRCLREECSLEEESDDDLYASDYDDEDDAKPCVIVDNKAAGANIPSGEIIFDPSSPAFRCPFFRACPSCKALLTHDGEGCKYITCPDCSTEFCFRCLCQECGPEENDVERCVIVDNNAAVANI